MDSYVAKPIRARELFGAMEQVLRQHPPSRPEAGADNPENDTMAEDFDRAAALERCGDDAGLLDELIDMFAVEIKPWMRDLGAAVEARDGKRDQAPGAHDQGGRWARSARSPAWDAAFRARTDRQGRPAGRRAGRVGARCRR